MLNVILVECALELVPTEISSLKEIQQHASRRKKKPTELLLDQSLHGRAMTKLEDSERRGRPDITYLCLMTLLETPLCKQGLLNVFLHLQDGRVVEVNPEVRLPRNYDRFVGLMEQLLVSGRVPPRGDALLSISDQSLSELIRDLRQDSEEVTLLATEGGQRVNIAELGRMFSACSGPVVFGVGAFPHGDFSSESRGLFNREIELDTEVMMAWHVCAEVVWTYSREVDLITKRFRQG
ncbi:16S rRNA methyltransferase [Candidatus Thorarchaeota archaeon]|nr:MAG: 16S rRNA methyltransferase [Candidatus Thorarchaeota archaeon]